MYKKNIVLIGFMGCGKTLFGNELAKIFKYDFVDMDNLIIQNESMSISDIFKKYGEDYFRELEKIQVIKVSKMKSTVISTGGGVVLHKANMDNLKKNGVIIYLKSNPKKIYENLKDVRDRPVLNERDKLKSITELMKIREPLYIKYCDVVVDVSTSNIDICIENLREEINKFLGNM